jgi:hypothetical protein
MSRRILAFAFIAVFAAFLVGGCSETQAETIENTIKDYYSAYNAEAWEACLGHIDDANAAGAPLIESTLKTARARTGEVTVESVTNINITGSTAAADVKITYGDQSETKHYQFVNKDGSWKIAWR